MYIAGARPIEGRGVLSIFGNFSFFDALSCQLAHRRHAMLWLSWGGVGWGGVGQ